MPDVPSLLALAANTLLGDVEAPYVLLSSPRRYIGTIVPDVTVREIHVDEDVITVHPVETGTPISDHSFANPKVIEVSGGFSDSTAGYAGHARQQYEAFLALKTRREPFNVSTGKRFYRNMLVASLTVSTDETSENAVLFTARLQEVIITSVQATGADQGRPANPASHAPEIDAGRQSLIPAPDASLYRAYDAPSPSAAQPSLTPADAAGIGRN